MRVGINALYLIPGSVGGTEIYLRSILPAMVRLAPQHQFVLFLNREAGALEEPGLERVLQVRCEVTATFRPARIIYEQIMLPVLAARHQLDVLWNAGFTAPVATIVPMVTAIHDLQHKIHPGFFRRRDLPFWNLLVWAAVKRSRKLLTFSEKTAQDLVRTYDISPERVEVVSHGVDERLFHLSNPDRGAGRTILAVSTLHPHKNLDRLLEAFSRFRASHPDYKLIIAGTRGFATESLERLCGQLGLRDSVVFTGWIAREELYELFRTARTFIYPSLFEGFGMPVLEALAAAIPTACSAIEPLLGIAGGAAIAFNPESVDEIEAALNNLLTFDGSVGPAQARLFSWDDAARTTLAVLESVLT